MHNRYRCDAQGVTVARRRQLNNDITDQLANHIKDDSKPEDEKSGARQSPDSKIQQRAALL